MNINSTFCFVGIPLYNDYIVFTLRDVMNEVKGNIFTKTVNIDLKHPVPILDKDFIVYEFSHTDQVWNLWMIFGGVKNFMGYVFSRVYKCIIFFL